MHIDKKNLPISSLVLSKIIDTIGSNIPERGGVLGADKDGIITEYYFDETSEIYSNRYAPDAKAINRVLSDEWIPRDVIMVGIVHSHANGNSVPSCGDISYGIRILNALSSVDAFYLPIVSFDSGVPIFNAYILSADARGQYLCRRIGVKKIEKEGGY